MSYFTGSDTGSLIPNTANRIPETANRLPNKLTYSQSQIRLLKKFLTFQYETES
jgi:hypothetical protein